MALENIDFNSIRPINGSKDKGFEEFVCQLAKRENIQNAVRFTRNGTPDGGIECFWELSNGKKWAWQAKFFQNSLGNSQFQQIENSLKTALTNDSNIEKYFIAIPIDPPASNIKDKINMRTKWNVHIKKWKEIYQNTDIVSWWYSDLITLLQKPENSTFLKFWFDKMFFDDLWFYNQNKSAICDLGPRYTPEINVEINSSMIFDGIEASNEISKLYCERLGLLFQRLQTLLRYNTIIIPVSLKIIKLCIEKLVQTYSNIDETATGSIIDFELVRVEIKKLNESLNNLYSINEESFKGIKKKCALKNSSLDEFDRFRSDLRRAENELYNLKEFTNSCSVRLYEAPFLLLTGDAGSGKSHQIAHYVDSRNKRGLKSVLLLGQKFTDLRDPKAQIIEQLDLDCKYEEFLEALNYKAGIEHNRIIIFIDAINEGAGYELWKSHLKGLIAQIKQYKYLGLVLSLRSTYLELFNDLLKEFSEFKLNGFYGIGYDAIRIFFAYYKIKVPTVPLLNPEFLNPLFLKLFCEGLYKNGIDSFDGNDLSIDHVFSFYVEAINKRVFKSNSSLDILKEIINALIDKQIEYGINTGFKYFTLAEICYNICHKYGITDNPWRELISEGLFFEDCYGENRYVRFTYERLNDFLLAQRVATSKNLPKIKLLLGAFRHPENYQGIYNALAILLPIHQKKEIFEYISSLKLEHVIVNSFVDSLYWRNTKNFDKKDSDFINGTVLKYEDIFFNALITCATNPNSYFNANKTHKYLMKQSLSDRDSIWTIFLHRTYVYDVNSIKCLLEWASYQGDKSFIDDNVIELSCIILGWFLVSQNRELRDRTTKALVVLLKDRPNITIKILKKFESVNDPYILERLYAIAYGVSLRANDLSFLPELSIYVYKTIFDKEKVYPHILLRDYARGIIEYAITNKIHLDIDKSKITPPYKSDFPRIPTDSEIKKYDIDYTDIKGNDTLWSVKAILNSMIVEYPRGGGRCLYGDFGRYVFQSAISNFKHGYQSKWDFISDMHNIAVKRIFDLGYDAKKHGNFDRFHSSEDRDVPKVERIGKKYQWIALHEILAYLSDKYKITANFWNKKDLGYFFSGPWEVYARDIDPSYIGKLHTDNIVSEFQYNAWNKDFTSWLRNEDDFPDPISIISGVGNEWLLLNGHLHWEEPKNIFMAKYDHSVESLFYHFNGYFIGNECENKIKGWLESKDFGGRWLPEASGLSEIFIGEYAWRFDRINDSYDFSKCTFSERIETGEYEEDNILNIDEAIKRIYGKGLKGKILKNKLKEHKIVKYSKTREIEIGNAFFTNAGDYSCSMSQDFSRNDNSINIPKPCKMLFDYFKLRHKEYENLLYDEKDELVCFSNKHSMYFKKNKLIEFLQKKNMCIIWTLLAEKLIMPEERVVPNTNTLSGVYSLSSNHDVIGKSKHSLGPSC